MPNGVMDVVRFQSPAGGSVPVTQTVTMNESFKPKAIIVFSVGTSGTFDADQASNAYVCFGATDLSGDDYSVAVVDKHSMPVSITGRILSTALCSATDRPTDNVYEDATVASIAPGSFTLTWGELSSTAYEYVAIVFGGSVRAKALTAFSKVTTGAWSVTNVGFKPDAVIICSQNHIQNPDTSASHLRYSFGMATRTPGATSVKDQRSINARSKNGVGMSNTARSMTDDSVYQCIDTGTETVDEEFMVSSFDDDGVSFYTTTSDGSSRINLMFFLKDVKANIVDILSPTSASTTTFSGMGFPARCGIVSTYGAPDYDNIRTQARIAYGAWIQGSGTSASGYGMAYASEDDVDTTNINLTDGDDTFTISQATAASIRGAMSTVTPDGGSVAWSTGDGYTRTFPSLGILPFQSTSKMSRPSKTRGLVA